MRKMHWCMNPRATDFKTVVYRFLPLILWRHINIKNNYKKIVKVNPFILICKSWGSFLYTDTKCVCQVLFKLYGKVCKRKFQLKIIFFIKHLPTFQQTVWEAFWVFVITVLEHNNDCILQETNYGNLKYLREIWKTCRHFGTVDRKKFLEKLGKVAWPQ